MIVKQGFSFCSESEDTQLAYVTFRDSQGAETAMLLTVSSSRYKLLLSSAYFLKTELFMAIQFWYIKYGNPW